VVEHSSRDSAPSNERALICSKTGQKGTLKTRSREDPWLSHNVHFMSSLNVSPVDHHGNSRKSGEVSSIRSIPASPPVLKFFTRYVTPRNCAHRCFRVAMSDEICRFPRAQLQRSPAILLGRTHASPKRPYRSFQQ